MKPNMKLASPVGMKTKAVKSRRIAWLLRKDGYQIEKVEPNKFKPEFDVYKFRAVPGIREDFVRHVKEMHERKMYKAS